MKLRRQTYSLDQYLRLMKAETIRTDQECQRLSGQWNANMVNELVYTILTDGYVPPIILGEEISNGIKNCGLSMVFSVLVLFHYLDMEIQGLQRIWMNT